DTRRVCARERQAEQLTALVVELALGCIEVLRPPPLPHLARAESEDAPAVVGQLEDDPAAEAIVQAALALGPLGQPGVVGLAIGVARAARRPQHAVVRARRVTNAELAQRLLLQPPAGEIFPRVARLVGLPQVALVESAGALEQLVEPLAQLPPLGRTRSLLLALQLDAVAVGEVLQRTDEVQALGLLYEGEHVAARPAAEAVVDLLDGIGAEGWRALLMEGAQPLEAVRAGPPQLGARGHQS